MSRLTALAGLALAVVLWSPSSAPADGCPLPCSGVNSSPPGSQLVFVQPKGDRGELIAYDTANGKLRFALPPGIASADGRRYFTATVRRASTWLNGYLVAAGVPFSGWSVPGRWTLGGVSPTGRWLALAHSGETRTKVAIVDASRRVVVHRLDLGGAFEVETVSRDGKRLFLIEHLAGGRYLVRLYDLSRESLRVNPLRAEGEDRVMAGFAWSGLASPDGRWLLTLYLSTQRSTAFVHALNLRSTVPACIDLPSGNGSLEVLKQYSLTLSPDGHWLYAANPALGVVAEIDLTQRRVSHVARFTPPARGTTVASTAALSPDGRRLVFARERALWAYDVAHGRIRGPYETWAKTVGLGFSRDAGKVYVVRVDGRMLAYDAATGRRLVR